MNLIHTSARAVERGDLIAVDRDYRVVDPGRDVFAFLRVTGIFRATDVSWVEFSRDTFDGDPYPPDVYGPDGLVAIPETTPVTIIRQKG